MDNTDISLDLAANEVIERLRRERPLQFARPAPPVKLFRRAPGPPRVAYVATIDASLSLLLLSQLRDMQAAGFEVTGISSPGEHVATLTAAGVRHVAVPMSRRYTPLDDLRSFVELWRVFRRERFDVVHTHTPKAALLGQYAALLAGVPVRFHTIHGLYFPNNARRHVRAAFVLLERLTMRFSQHNFSVNPEDVPVAIVERISSADRIEYVGGGINLALFDPLLFPPAQRAMTRAALGLGAEHLVVGMVARLVAEKGYREMFQAARAIRTVVPNARFLFIGGFEPEKGDAIGPDALSEHGIADVAQFLGHRSDVPDLLSIMDVHVLPSYREGFPLAPMEASAMGVPSVVTDVRGCRQAVDDGVTGVIVPARDPLALATAIRTLLLDAALRARMGAAARTKAVREFDDRLVFAKIRAVYGGLVGWPDGQASR